MKNAMENAYDCCVLCVRKCGARRSLGEVGFCKCGDTPVIAHADLHMWEEPCISGENGSGAIFFSGCSLGCIFCQNNLISRAPSGRVVDAEGLSEIMLGLAGRGAHNINFVTPTHFAPSVARAVGLAREKGLSIPIVYNTGSYDTVETIKSLNDTVDVFLPDYKYYKSKTALEYSGAERYPETAFSAISEMVKQKGEPVLKDGIMTRGVIVRILLLPGHSAQAKLSVKKIFEAFGSRVYISLMCQYTPMPGMPKPLDRRVTVAEYNELVSYAERIGVVNGFTQEQSSASEIYIPRFNFVMNEKNGENS